MVITGIDGCGKSTLCSELYKRFNVFRSVGVTSNLLLTKNVLNNYEVIERFQPLDDLILNGTSDEEGYWDILKSQFIPYYQNSLFLVYLNTFNESKIHELGVTKEYMIDRYIQVYTKFKELSGCQLQFLKMPSLTDI